MGEGGREGVLIYEYIASMQLDNLASYTFVAGYVLNELEWTNSGSLKISPVSNQLIKVSKLDLR